MICKNCGGDISAGLNFCPDCGSKVADMFPEETKDVSPVIEETAFPEPAEAKVSAPEAAVTAAAAPAASYQQNYQQSSYQKPAYQYDPNAEKAKGKAITSLVCGIIAIVLCCTFYLSGIGLILAIVGLAKSSGAKKLGYNGGVRKAGFGCSIGALIASILEGIILIFLIVAMVFAATTGATKVKKSYDSGEITDEQVEQAIKDFFDETDL